MGAYRYTSRKSTPSDASWMWVHGERSTVQLNKAGNAWKFTITISVNNSYRLNVRNWNNSATKAKHSKMIVTLREDSSTGKIIGTASVNFRNTPMTGVDLTKTMATVTIDNIKSVTQRVYVEIHANLRGVYGTNGKPGVYYVSKNKNITDLYEYGYFDVSDIQLNSKPVLYNLQNDNKYNGQDGVSASANSISIKWALLDGDAPTSSQYRLNGGAWQSADNLYDTDITGLVAYTTYNIDVRGSNDAGTSDIISITIRTLANPPTVTLKLIDELLEELKYTWTANVECSNMEYKYIVTGNTTEKSSTVNNAKTGDISIQDLEPNMTVIVAVRVKSTDKYDGLWSSYTDYVEGTTDKIAELTSDPNIIFGDTFVLTKINPSGNLNRIEVEAGDDYVHIFTIDPALNSINHVPTDSELDKMYKQYKNTNTIPIRYKVITLGKVKEYSHVSNGIVTLTGNMKTSHVGVTNIPRRCKIWIGDEDKIPRRCVAWIGDENGIARRCI